MNKKILNLFFAVAMVLSVAFIGELTSNHNPYSAQAQTATVKKKSVGVVRKAYKGGKYIGKQGWTGTKWVGLKSRDGAKFIAGKTWNGTKWVGRKIKRAVY